MKHWHRVNEVGSLFGMKLLLFIYGFIGRRPLKLVLHFVAGYYYLFHKTARLASEDYLERYNEFCGSNNLQAKQVSSYRHIYNFASMILDKVSAWRGDITLKDLNFPEQANLHKYAETKTGLFFLTAHFGNMDICRALVRSFPEVKVDLFIHTDNAEKFNNFIKSVSNDSQLNFISVGRIGMQTGIEIQSKIEQGHWIYIMADRTPPNELADTLESNLFGEPIVLPKGPFILSSLLQAPIFSMNCYPDGPKFKVKSKLLAPAKKIARQERENFMKELAHDYSRELEQCMLDAPMEWFNFYNYWHMKNEAR